MKFKDYLIITLIMAVFFSAQTWLNVELAQGTTDSIYSAQEVINVNSDWIRHDIDTKCVR